MRIYLIPLLCVAMLFGAIVRPVAADITAEEVRESIKRGRAFLISQQQPRGNWAGYSHHSGGVTALCTLALLNSATRPTHLTSSGRWNTCAI